MFLWTDPFKQSTEKEGGTEDGQAAGLVSARWLALDSILRSLILDPEGPEMRAMMRRDIRMMNATGRVHECCGKKADAYGEAVEVMNSWKKSIS
jgi:hypothetical protein